MKKLRLGCWLLSVCFLTPLTLQALGPQECVILVNRRSMQSMELANFYADLRQIPAVNVIHLDLPATTREAGASFTVAEFNDYIRDPVNKILRERNIAGHVLVWLYSLDFPTIISTTPPMSLNGITFTRGEPPPGDQVMSGNWLSPLFIGPDKEDGPASPPASFENFTIALTNRMPIPSMLLGWSGSRGMTMDQIKQQLRSAAASDGALPSASTFFELINDVRSQTRAWQFPPATRELATLGIAAFTAAEAPPDRSDVMGILGGRAVLDGTPYGTLKPGAYADHLTSFAGLFHDPDQTKLTEWLRRGAAGSSGTITEPGSLTVPVRLGAKFPMARLFTHYASGCTLAESLFLATRCPLQILFVGDALCNPWAKPPGMTLINMADDEKAPISGKAEFLASSWGGFGQAPPTTIFFLDGRPVGHPGNKPSLEFDSTRLNDGYHELLVVGYSHEQVRHQGGNRIQFSTRNNNRSSTIGGYTPRQKVDLYRPLTFTISAEGTPREAAIVVQERVVARAPYTTNMTLQLQPMTVGAGPVSFQAVVVYPDNEPVRSAPLVLDIQSSLNQAPVISDITIITNSTDGLVVTYRVTDPESDPINRLWYADVTDEKKMPSVTPKDHVATFEMESGSLTFAASNSLTCAVFEVDEPSRIKEIAASFRLIDGGNLDNRHHAGLVFNYIDENNYMFWGLNGHLGAWVLINKRDGIEKQIFSRGAPITLQQDYRLFALDIGSQKIAFFVDDNLQGVADLNFGTGRVGVRNGLAAARYDHLYISPPSAVRSYFSEVGEEVRIRPEFADEINILSAAARDVQLTTIKPVVK